MKLLLVGIAVLVVFGKWVDGFVEFSLNETEISLLEGYGVSKAGYNPLMVGLTLIQGANAKGAGTLLFSFLQNLALFFSLLMFLSPLPFYFLFWVIYS